MWLAWIWTAASAAPQGHWHPDELAPQSQQFVSSSERLQGPFSERSGAIEQLAVAIRHYREGLDLLGDAAPASERARVEALEHDHQRQYAVLQDFADVLVSDYDTVFTAAVERAVAARGGEIVQCEGQLADGPRLPGMPPKLRPNPECTGEDLNPALAAAVDGDATLKAQLEEVLSRPWPAVSVTPEPQAPIGQGERWLSVRDLMVAGARSALRAIDARDDDARAAIEAAIEQGSSTAELQQLEPEARRIEAETAAARAALAAPVLAAANGRIAKWKGEPTTAWCANPTTLGGCTGADASRDLVGRLVDDKKVAKAFAAAGE